MTTLLRIRQRAAHCRDPRVFARTRRGDIVLRLQISSATPATAASSRTIEIAWLAGIGSFGIECVIKSGISGSGSKAAGVDLRDGSRDRNSARVDHNTIATDLKTDLRQCFECDLASVQFGFGFYDRREISLIIFDHVALHRLIKLAVNANVIAVFDMQIVVAADSYGEIAAGIIVAADADDLLAIAAAGFVHRTAGTQVVTFLRTYENLFFACLVLKSELVKALSIVRRRTCFDVRHCLEFRQIVVRHSLGVVDRTDDDRLVRIAFHKIDDNFLANTRNEHRAPFVAGDRRANADPTRRRSITTAFAIPVELHFHTPVFIDKDLFARRPDDNSSLTAMNDRLSCSLHRPERRLALALWDG